MRNLFGTKGRLKLFRLIRGIGMGDLDASLHTESNEDGEQKKTFNSDAYVLAKNAFMQLKRRRPW